MNTRNNRTKHRILLGAASSVSVLVGSLVATASPVTAATHSAVLPGTGKTITVTTAVNTSLPTEQKQWQIDLARAFHKLTGATVRFDSFTTTAQELTMLEKLTVTHQGPDVFKVGSTFVPTAYGTGSFITLNNADWAAVGGRSRFFKASLAMSGPSASDQIAVPIYNGPYGLVYNKTLFLAAGISSPPHTWSQLVTDAEKLTNPKKGVYGFAFDPQDSFDPWHMLWLITKQMGGDLVSPDLKTATLTSTKARAAMRFILDWYTKFHIVNPASLGWNASQMFAAFTSGKAAMIPWVSVGDVPALNGVPFKWAFAPHPEIPYGATTVPVGGHAISSFSSAQLYAVSKYSRYPALDFAWIKLYTSQKMQELLQRLVGWQPANRTAALVGARENPVYRPFIAAENASLATPFTVAWGDLEVAVGSAVNTMASDLASGNYTPNVMTQQLAKANAVVQAHLGT